MTPEPANNENDDTTARGGFFASPEAYRRCFADGHLLALALFAAVIVFFPSFMDTLLSEDGYVEIPTAALALGSAVLALRARSVYARGGDRRGRTRCLMYLLLFILVFGEENDWGLRLLDFQNMVHGVNVNTLHEVLEVALKDGAEVGWRIGAAVLAVLFLLLLILAIRGGVVALWPPGSWDRAQRLGMVALAMFAIGQLRDTGTTTEIGLPKVIYRQTKELAEEYRKLEELVKDSGQADHLPDKRPDLAEPKLTEGRYADPDVFGSTLGPKFPEEIFELFGASLFFFAGWTLLLASKGSVDQTPPPSRGLWSRTKWFLTGG